MAFMIEVRGLSKSYHYGQSLNHTATVRELLVGAFVAPFRKKPGEPEPVRDTFWALKDVNFDVAQGEIVGIIGANGAGKSTLLKILSRITDPTAGRVTLRGRMASLLEVGTGFHPELTGRENVFLNGAVLGMKNVEIKARFDEIVAFAEVEKFLDTPVKHYSSGMSVRLGFAVAAHLQPEILIVDEVLAVGDMAFQKKCLGKMSEVSKGGRTVLFVSHNMAAVENLCQRGILLKQGQLVYDGDSKSAVGQYLEMSTVSSGDNSSSIDLSDAPSRISKFKDTPDHKSILQKLDLFTDGDRPAPRAVQIGARLLLRFHLHTTREIPSFTMSIGINNTMGQRVLTLHTVFSPTVGHELSPGDSILECDVASLPLMPGQYNVSIVVDNGDIRLDAVPDAFALNVLDSDFYGTGRSPFSGIFVAPHRWTLTPLSDAALREAEPALPGVAG
jgi:lipopolysaccharide transport system ATP-binding protein